MPGKVLIYLGAFLPFVWGVSHLFPTKNVVRGFGDISEDNKKIITMEWINEGVTLIFAGLIVAGVTYIGNPGPVSLFIYWIVAIMLFVLALVSVRTGARIKFPAYRLCPVIFSVSAILILVGAYL